MLTLIGRKSTGLSLLASSIALGLLAVAISLRTNLAETMAAFFVGGNSAPILPYPLMLIYIAGLLYLTHRYAGSLREDVLTPGMDCLFHRPPAGSLRPRRSQPRV